MKEIAFRGFIYMKGGNHRGYEWADTNKPSDRNDKPPVPNWLHSFQHAPSGFGTERKTQCSSDGSKNEDPHDPVVQGVERLEKP